MSETLSETRVANTCLIGSGPVRSGSVRVRLVEFGIYHYATPAKDCYIELYCAAAIANRCVKVDALRVSVGLVMLDDMFFGVSV